MRSLIHDKYCKYIVKYIVNFILVSLSDSV